MQSQPLLLLSFLITFQMFFIGAFLLFSQKGKRRSNRILGVLFLLMGLNIGDLTLQLSGYEVNFGIIQVIDDTFILLYGPLFYLYIQLVIYKDYKIPKLYWLHMLPFGIFALLLIVSYGPNVTGINPATGTDAPLATKFLSYMIYVHVLTYLGIGFNSLFHYRRIIKDQYSKIDHINLDWLQFALTTLTVITIISLTHNIFVLSGNVYIYSISILFLLVFLVYFVNRVILKALAQPEIFAGIEQGQNVKYAQSKLSDEQVEVYVAKLTEVLQVEKLYRNPQLSIHDLSERLGIAAKTLSQVINQSFDKNFFDLVNSYRISEAQQILAGSADPKPTILEVLYEVGFNSKSSFNTAFKKVTGQTPTEFRKNKVEKGSTS